MGVPRNPQHGITPADSAGSGCSPRRPRAGPPGATTKRVRRWFLTSPCDERPAGPAKPGTDFGFRHLLLVYGGRWRIVTAR